VLPWIPQQPESKEEQLNAVEKARLYICQPICPNPIRHRHFAHVSCLLMLMLHTKKGHIKPMPTSDASTNVPASTKYQRYAKQTNFHSSAPSRVSYRYEKSSSPPPPRPSPSIISTLNTNSFVSLAISNAIGGRDWFHALHARSPSSSSRPSLAMALPFSPASTKRCLICANFRTIGSPCVLSGPLAVEDMAASVEDTTVPTTSEMALIWVEMAAMPASERIEETNDWMFWTNNAV